MNPPWILVRLALDTRHHHVQANEDRLAALDVRTVADYKAILVRIYGFEAPVEAAIAMVPGLDPALVRACARSGRLREDLSRLGMSPAEIAELPLFTSFDLRTAPRALGWMFVLEQQALVSGLLRRQVIQVLGRELAGATTYFATHEDSRGGHFRAFGEALAVHARKFPPVTMSTAAHDAFRAQRQWYAGRERSFTAPAAFVRAS